MTTYNNLTQAEKDALREQRKKYGNDLFYIHQAMHESILPRVAAAITPKQAWDTLGKTYQGLDKIRKSNLQILRRDFESLSMKDSETIDTFYTRVVSFINQLKSHGEGIEDQMVVEKFSEVFPQYLKTWL